MGTKSFLDPEPVPFSLQWSQMPEWDRDPAEAARLLRSKASAFHRLTLSDTERRDLFKAAGYRLQREIDLANVNLFESRKTWLRNLRSAPPDSTGTIWIFDDRELLSLADSLTIQELASLRDKGISRGWSIQHFLFEAGLRSGRAESPYPPVDPLEFFKAQVRTLHEAWSYRNAIQTQNQ